MSSSSQYSYEYNLSQSPRENRWNTSSDSNATIYEEVSSPTGYAPANFGLQQTGNDVLLGNQFMSDQQLADMSQNLSLLQQASSSGFVGPGLPFRALDFIRNYNPAGYMMTDQDALWQSLDPSTFMDPDIPFTLGGELSVEGQDGQHWSSEGQPQ
jgi:hypothetical protein